MAGLPDSFDPWPLRALRLRTPRLELRPDDDAGLFELAEQARGGVHPPEQMPFDVPWTDADPRDIGRNVLQHFWSQRAALRPAEWSLHFLIRVGGRVIGVQSVSGTNFAVTREVTTGSWLGIRHQRQGYGTEMRAAVLALAFDHLGARTARSSAFVDNPASLAISHRLGYCPDGSMTAIRRGAVAEQVRLLLTWEEFQGHRPAWRPEVEGLAGCRGLLGA
ncbi:GNAT family N-acetyltransferase [Pseudonocardia acaciae]|uniref:GNAT family N-acetyltransferase n=1 Tax=Pseudonocardia acaciae TaxID=551276 RepID=UPI00048F1051|nr:GNAT family N-acetyltransferase [Pseudonocardia acaciae]